MKLNTIIKSIVVFSLLSFSTFNDGTTNDPPSKSDFVDLKELMPNLRSDMRYYGSDNFVGRPIAGYNQPKCLLTKEAANAQPPSLAISGGLPRCSRPTPAGQPKRAVYHAATLAILPPSGTPFFLQCR